MSAARSRLPPSPGAPNAWARLLERRRAAGARLLDLAEANPTRVGLGGAGAPELAALGDPRGALYRPDPRGELAAREAVAGACAERGLAVSPDQVVLTSGTSEAYAHLFRLLCEPGEEILAPRPSYPLFEPLAALAGVRAGAYRLAHDGRWHLDVASLEAAAGPRTRGLIVVQPNHPTGSCLSPPERAAVARVCARGGLSLIADEVFADFPWPAAGSAPSGPAQPPRAGPPLPSLGDLEGVPTFVLGGLSKACGMPQMKAAWIVATGPEPARRRALEGLEWIADLFLSVSTPVQLALPRLLAARHAFRERVAARLAVNLGRLRAAVARRPELSLLDADGGWVAVLRVPASRSEEEWALGLLRRDVVVHPGYFYDFAEGTHLVLSLIPEPEVFAEGVARLEALAAEG